MMIKLKIILKKIILLGIKTIQQLVDDFFGDENIHLVSCAITPEQLQDIQARLDYYVPGRTLITQSCLTPMITLSSQPILTFGGLNYLSERYKQYRAGIFNIDHNKNPLAAWDWCRLSEYCGKETVNIEDSSQRFNKYVDLIRREYLDKVYIFGTGPSLSKAVDLDWSDGYRIVCNTIVRDPDLWHKINPHFIVAGDTVYHFSYTKFACAFRRDLALRLSESNAFFVYPALFHQLVIRELGTFSSRLVPIPINSYTKINIDLYKQFYLPSFNNVLPLLLLPLACTLSKRIFLWGFDGRAPTDQLFWSNSAKHSYPEFLQDLQINFPAFFDYLVPADNPSQYVKSVHGNLLEEYLQTAEKEGWYFEMMHKTWTPTLQKRCKESI